MGDTEVDTATGHILLQAGYVVLEFVDMATSHETRRRELPRTGHCDSMVI